jgi:hypothetical protein
MWKPAMGYCAVASAGRSAHELVDMCCAMAL